MRDINLCNLRQIHTHYLFLIWLKQRLIHSSSITLYHYRSSEPSTQRAQTLACSLFSMPLSFHLAPSASALLTPAGWALARDTLNVCAALGSGAQGGYCRSTQGCSRCSKNHSGWHRTKASLLLPHPHGPAPCSMDKHCACEAWPAARSKAWVVQWFPLILDSFVYLLICKQTKYSTAFRYTGHSYAIYSLPCPHLTRLGRVFTVPCSVHERSSIWGG